MNSTLTVQGYLLYDAFVSGAKKLLSIKSKLNQINVFPVADGDTGNNLASLMNSVIMLSKKSPSIGETMDSIALAAMRGSKGNSGIIVSEYFNGIAEQLRGKSECLVNELNEAMQYAIKKAYQAISKPVEGTILTVLRKAFSHGCTEDIQSYFHESYRLAKSALEETVEQLDILKQNQLVDAGALGFTSFLEGINDYFQFGVTEYSVSEDEPLLLFDHVHTDEITQRYCTESFLSEVTLSQEEMIELLKNEGSSLIVSKNQNYMRLHIHTNHPENLFKKLHQVGTILEQKVDDMVMQTQDTQRMQKTVIVTDSIADIPSELRTKYLIHQIPVTLTVDGSTFLDQQTISTQTFYEMMDSASSLSSSQPDTLTIQRNLDFLRQHYESVIIVSVSSALSGTYNSFKRMADQYKEVYLVDSLQNSGAEGMIVLEAAKLAQQGMDAEKIVSHLMTLREKTKIYVSVRTLKYMVKQGRLSKAKGFLAKILNMKPVVSLDKEGKGEIAKTAYSISSNERKILKLIQSKKIKSYAIVHARAEKRALRFQSKVKRLTGLSPEYITEISSVIAMNAGIGAIAISIIYE